MQKDKLPLPLILVVSIACCAVYFFLRYLFPNRSRSWYNNMLKVVGMSVIIIAVMIYFVTTHQ